MSSVDLASPDKKTIRRFFDGIAFRYDFLNTLLSLRLDDGWRKRSARLALTGQELSILDLGIGTGKFLEVFQKVKPWETAVGVDFSAGMLARAKSQMAAETRLVSADFHDLPFKGEQFDLVISAFTLRSVKEMDRFLGQVFGLLKNGGKAVFLDLTRPAGIWKLLYYPYLNGYLPIVGALFSGDRAAYRFLSQSIQHFQDPAQTMELMRQTGFRDVRRHTFTMGAATLILGVK